MTPEQTRETFPEHVIMALGVCADEAGFVDVDAAMRRAAVTPAQMRAALCFYLKSGALLGANRAGNGVLPESGYQLAEYVR